MQKLNIFVGLSGGVDSAVAAYLLQRQGHTVMGVYLKCWEGLPTDKGLQFTDACHWREERRDALAVAAALHIPFKTYDFVAEYRREVVDYFFREYERGRTPNPDVLCNRDIKFKSFLERAKKEGASAIATGHYARRRERQGRVELLAGVDESKDQSYFLWTLGQKELVQSYFPVGDYRKSAIRKLAEKVGIPTAHKPDSQGICFVGKVPVQDFLRSRIPEEVGQVVTADGKVVGTHRGASFYTIGQRHGLALTAKLPYYVSRINIKENIITVAEGNSDLSLYQKQVVITDTSWVSARPKPGYRYQARIRYRQKLEPVVLKEVQDESFRFVFDNPQRAVAPGQSFVLYDGDVVIGGGIIDAT